MSDMRYKIGDRFKVLHETYKTWGEEQFSKGEVLEIVGIAPLDITTRSGGNGYLLSAYDGVLPRPYPRRFFENYCEIIEASLEATQ